MPIPTVGSTVTGWPRNQVGQAGGGGMVSTQISNHANFKYIPFVPNAINTCDAGGVDVISYPFSGCIMATFQENGVRKVCHVSTGGGQDCKAAWNNLKKQYVNVFEFKPSDFVDAEAAMSSGGGLDGVYGLITTDLRCYAITVTKDKAGSSFTVAGVKQCRLHM